MNKIIFRNTIILAVLLFASYSYGGIKYFQSTKLNTDGSITMSITYSATSAEIAKNKNLIGKFSFDQNQLKEYFNFSGATFLKSNLHKDPEDPNKTAVTVEINTKNIFKIMEARVFKDIKIAYLKSDTGMIFSWYIPNDYIVSNSIDTYNFFVTSDIEIKSTNGLMNDNKINWFIFGNKPDPRGYYYVTTVKSDGKFVTTETKDSKNNSDSSADKKIGCGLFGIELPLIVFLGFAFSNISKRRKEYLKK
ncbi:MAG: hypothetical protein IPP52_18620 [Ignavibacteria bacterium]|nr:hypothetical protein [Ignavibacteria bacterium]